MQAYIITGSWFSLRASRFLWLFMVKKKKKEEMRNSTVDSFTTSATNRINPPFFSRASACIDLHKYFFFFYFSRNNRYFVVGRGPLNQARLSVLTFRQTEGLKTTLVNFCQFSLKSNKKLIISRYSYFCEIFFVKY